LAFWGGLVATESSVSKESQEETPEATMEENWSVVAKSVGIDLGYGFVKLVAGEEELKFPSVVGPGKQLAYQSDFQISGGPLDHLAIKLDNREYFVGNLAIRQSGIASRSLDQDRVTDMNSKILMLTALSLLSQWENQVFNLITGLPTSYFAAYKNEWAASLFGQFTVSFNNGTSYKQKKFSIDSIKIVPQPFGTLYDQMLNQYGKAINTDFSDMKIGILDIGFKTTDFAMADELEYIQHLSFSTNTALSSAYKMIGDRLREEYKIDKEDYELDRIIERNSVRVAGKAHDLTNLKREIFGLVAGKIITELDSHWDFKELDLIFITGGGGRALSEFILPKFSNAVLVEGSQHANARGFHKLAQSVFSSK
jgi:plasmid segregation protein ParM